MRNWTCALGLAVACIAGACTNTTETSTGEPSAGPGWVPPLEEVEPTVEAIITPSPEMLKAALSNDPEAMTQAASLTGTCNASNTCPAEFASCTNWSAPTLCSQTCSGFCFCRPVIECEGEPPEPRGTNSYNSFRVCFNAAQQPCTQWQKTNQTFCGCEQ